MRPVTSIAAALIFAASLSVQPALAAGDSWSTPPQANENPDYAAGKLAVEAKDWKTAVAAFTRAVAGEPQNASAYNYLAFSYRKSGNLELAFKNYAEALRLDPKHRGAHEYIGEAYLTSGNLAKAEEHLKVLDELCFFPCAEYSALKQSVADFKASSQK